MSKIFTRRSFIAGAAAGVGTYAVLGGPAILTSRGQSAGGGALTQGVASAEPTDDAITLWTRVDDLSGNRRVNLEVATDAGFGGSRVVHSDSVPLADGNAIAKTRVNNLEAGTEYFYRFSTDGDDEVGRFRTTRGDSKAEPARIAFFSCQEYIAGFYYAHMDLAAREDIDLVVCLGDYIYEQAFASVPVREDPTGEVQTLDEYRAKYNLYHRDENLIAVRKRFPLMSIYDDHEVEDNWAGMLPGGQTQDRRITFRDRMVNGHRAFFEYMPQRFPGNIIYRSIKVGGHAELFVLDTRRYRDNQVCSPGDMFFSGPQCPMSEYNKPGRTLLGKEQKQWLKDGLEASDATWKVIGTQVMIMSLDLPARSPLNSDSWDGYGDERRELIEFIGGQDADGGPVNGGNGVDDVTFITGDIHTFFAGNVTRSGRESAGAPVESGDEFFIPDGPVRATEFVGGSITTEGIADRAGQDENTNTGAALPADAQVMADNFHIKFSCQAFKGYGILEAGANELKVTYRAVRDATDPNDMCVFTLKEFTVPKGGALPETERETCPVPPQGDCGPPTGTPN